MRAQDDKAREYAFKWLEAMEKHYGVKPILYTYDSYYNSYLKGRGFDGYDFFIARYSGGVRPRVPHLEPVAVHREGELGRHKEQGGSRQIHG